MKYFTYKKILIKNFQVFDIGSKFFLSKPPKLITQPPKLFKALPETTVGSLWRNHCLYRQGPNFLFSSTIGQCTEHLTWVCWSLLPRAGPECKVQSTYMIYRAKPYI